MCCGDGARNLGGVSIPVLVGALPAQGVLRKGRRRLGRARITLAISFNWCYIQVATIIVGNRKFHRGYSSYHGHTISRSRSFDSTGERRVDKRSDSGDM